MTEIPTEDEFMSMVRRHEVAACGVKKDDTRTHETTLATLTQAKRDHLYAHDAQAARIAELEAESVRLMQIGRDLEAASQEQFDAIECVEMELTQAHKHIAKLEAELARWRRNYPTSAAWEHALLLKEATDDTES